MRRFSDGFLDAYLGEEGAAVLDSVGAYRLEGRGVQLFERMEGDYFTILGFRSLSCSVSCAAVAKSHRNQRRLP